jgi:redox-sensitive bicupin YhaK (pirin superfamily)
VLYKGEKTRFVIDQGKLVVHPAMPGLNIPGHADHGYGPLALIAESFMAPDTWITMHEHVQDEIISYVPDGVMRHDDRTTGKLLANPGHLMVMNAGRSFWHEERTFAGDLPVRMLQIFVRPHTLDLEPRIQHGPLAAPEPNRWRHLVGPERGAAPFFVRNDLDLYDVRLEKGASVTLPHRPGWARYFFVYSGSVEAERTRFDQAESGLITDFAELVLRAIEPAHVVAFVMNAKARITRSGTIGDRAALLLTDAAPR